MLEKRRWGDNVLFCCCSGGDRLVNRNDLQVSHPPSLPPPPHLTAPFTALHWENPISLSGRLAVSWVKTVHCQSFAFIFCETWKILHSDSFSQLNRSDAEIVNSAGISDLIPSVSSSQRSQQTPTGMTNLHLRPGQSHLDSDWKRLNSSATCCWSSIKYNL